MKLTEIGEFGLINRFSGKFDALMQQGFLGIGDDCAIIPFNDQEDYIISTDLLTENVHFLKQDITPKELGRKSLAVNLSDIAAMGGLPVASFLSVGIPNHIDIAFMDEFMEGFYELSRKYNVPLLGGDTTRSDNSLVINVTVIGKCEKDQARLRSMACTNDLICVTGNLGDSAAGLRILVDKLARTDLTQRLIDCHHNIEPRIKEGVWLAKQKEIHAMMDISDGIASDLSHILKASDKSAIIDIEQIPISDNLYKISKKYSWNPAEIAITGGEDYELLFTVNPVEFEKLNSRYQNEFSKSLHRIGTIKKGDPEIVWLENEKEVNLENSGFSHF